MKMNVFASKLMFALTMGIPFIAVNSFASDPDDVRKGISLACEGLKITFGEATAGYGIKSLENTISEPVSFGSPIGAKTDFWRLVFTLNEGSNQFNRVSLDNRSPCRERRVQRMAEGLMFYWLGLSVPGGESGAVDVRAEVKLVGRAESEWNLSVVNRDSRWALFETQYPCIPQVVPDGEADILVPGRNLGGRLVKRYNSRKEWRSSWGYPGLYPMVMGFMRKGAGLYVAAHDPEARIKTLSLSPGCNLFFRTVVENAGVPVKAAEGPRYPVVISAFRGDWWQVARRYRTWALGQRWCSRGPIVSRPDYPKAMVDVDIWLLSNQCSADNLCKRIAKIRRFYPDMKIGVHWYGWNAENPSLGECPYFAPGSNVATTVAFMKSQDVLLMPYVDGRLLSKNSDRFSEMVHGACYSASGALYEEKWGANHYVVMCPTAPGFVKAVQDTATNVVFGSDFGALYEDQIACSRAMPCFNVAHGHPLGGGAWWTDGYRNILTPMHASLAAANRPITSEGAGEMWLDLIDGYLQAESPQESDVPFYPAVYGGYAVYFGARIKCKDPQAYFALQARAMAWGVAPNWQRISDDFVFGRIEGSIDTLRRVARMRKMAGEFLKYGSLEDELRILDVVKRRRVNWYGADGEQCGKPFSAELPEVFGTVWRSRSGSRNAVCVVNIGDAAHTIRFESVFKRIPVLLVVEGEAASKMSIEGSVVSLVIPPQGLAVLTDP
jgi:hypothetical protein